jgi:MOSC domain-containing protein YiiM
MPREVDWHGRLVRTSIFKSPVLGPVRVARLNLEGEEQSDLTAHGGIHKAVYVYSSEHYLFRREEIPD